MSERDPSPAGHLSIDDAVRCLRADPLSAELVRDAYLGRDVADSARRFLESGELAEVSQFSSPQLAG